MKELSRLDHLLQSYSQKKFILHYKNQTFGTQLQRFKPMIPLNSSWKVDYFVSENHHKSQVIGLSPAIFKNFQTFLEDFLGDSQYPTFLFYPILLHLISLDRAWKVSYLTPTNHSSKIASYRLKTNKIWTYILGDLGMVLGTPSISCHIPGIPYGPIFYTSAYLYQY